MRLIDWGICYDGTANAIAETLMQTRAERGADYALNAWPEQGLPETQLASKKNRKKR